MFGVSLHNDDCFTLLASMFSYIPFRQSSFCNGTIYFLDDDCYASATIMLAIGITLSHHACLCIYPFHSFEYIGITTTSNISTRSKYCGCYVAASDWIHLTLIYSTPLHTTLPLLRAICFNTAISDDHLSFNTHTSLFVSSTSLPKSTVQRLEDLTVDPSQWSRAGHSTVN